MASSGRFRLNARVPFAASSSLSHAVRISGLRENDVRAEADRQAPRKKDRSLTQPVRASYGQGLSGARFWPRESRSFRASLAPSGTKRGPPYDGGDRLLQRGS